MLLRWRREGGGEGKRTRKAWARCRRSGVDAMEKGGGEVGGNGPSHGVSETVYDGYATLCMAALPLAWGRMAWHGTQRMQGSYRTICIG